MLPSLTQPILSVTTAVAVAEPLLSGIAPAAKGAAGAAAGAIGTCLAIADRLIGSSAQEGFLSARVRGGAPARGARAKAVLAGYARSAIVAKSSSTGAASSTSATTSKTSTSAKNSGPLAFLDDPKLSVEDKLMKLLAYLNDKWDKDIDKKMKEIGAGAAGTAGSSTSKASAGTAKPKENSSFLGTVVKAAKEFFPAVGIAAEALANPAVREVASTIGGPVLAAAATALGFPELAPALLKYGPQVVDLASGAASALVDAGAAPANGGASASSGGDAKAAPSDGGAMSDRKVQERLMEIQRVIDQQKEMFSLVSNMLRSAHETRMAVIQNVRS